MKRILLLTICFAICILTKAQKPEPEWIKQINVNSDYQILSSIADCSGNVYTTGTFDDTVDFDLGAGVANLIPNGQRDIFISKLDASGSFVWAKQLGDDSLTTPYSIAIDKNSNIYITGWFKGTADFNPNKDTFKLTSKGEDDVFILKLDDLGDFIWVKQIGGVSYDGGFSIKVNDTGNVYIMGCFTGSINFNPNEGKFILKSSCDYEVFILKLNTLGDLIWAKKMGFSTGDDPPGFAIDILGNVYITNAIKGKVDLDPGKGRFYLKSKSWYAKFILKLNPSGAFVWGKKINANNYDWEPKLTVDNKGNVYITSNFNGIVDFDPGKKSFKLESVGESDFYILKLDQMGNFKWVKHIESKSGNIQANEIVTDLDGNIYTTGQFSGTIDLIITESRFNLTSNGDMDIYVSKSDSSGNFIWVKKIGGPTRDIAHTISLDCSENIFVSGNINEKAQVIVQSEIRHTHTIYKGAIFILKIEH